MKILIALIVTSCFAFSNEFLSIFNGNNLENWKSNEETSDCFSVENNCLKVSGGRAHLFYVVDGSDAEVGDFELKLEVKTKKGANSGVYFHTQFQEEGWPEVGYECQVNATHVDPKKTGSLYGVSNIYVNKKDKNHKPGSSFQDERTGENKVLKKSPNKDGAWFEYHIVVSGKTVQIFVNGELQINYTEPDVEVPHPRIPQRKIGRGTFALQAHDPKSTTYYRNIRLKLP